MNYYDRWLDQGLDEYWGDSDEEDEDPRLEFCQDEYMTNEEVKESLQEAYMEEQYELHCNVVDAD